MKLLVTGHKGFIGSHYYDYVKDTYDVIGYDQKDGFESDLKCSDVANQLPDTDVVVHLAATKYLSSPLDCHDQFSYNY